MPSSAEGLQQLGVHLVEAVVLRLAAGGGVVRDGLEVRHLVLEVRPLRVRLLRVREELHYVAEGLQPPLEHPLRLVLLGGDEADGVLGEAGGGSVGLDLGDEAVLVAALLLLEVGDEVVLGIRRHLCGVRGGQRA
jgi:hypothetical protein